MNFRLFAKLSAAATAVFTAGPMANADTYALLIGINDYPDVLGPDGKPAIDKETGKPIDPDLKGAVNDVTEMRGILVDKYGVPAGNIRVVTDKQANEAGFIENMKWLLGVAKPGDQIIFHYSGHGGQIKSETEEDKKDEVIVLADDKLVSDNLFGELARAMANKGVHATFLFDSCHSGGMSREAGVRIKNRRDLMVNARARKIAPTQLAGLKSTARGAITGSGNEKGSYAFLFASKEDQTSSDVSGMTKFPAHGIFTLGLSLALKDKPEFTLTALEMLMIDLLNELKFKQIPNFEFSSADRANKPLVWK